MVRNLVPYVHVGGVMDEFLGEIVFGLVLAFAVASLEDVVPFVTARLRRTKAPQRQSKKTASTPMAAALPLIQQFAHPRNLEPHDTRRVVRDDECMPT